MGAWHGAKKVGHGSRKWSQDQIESMENMYYTQRIPMTKIALHFGASYRTIQNLIGNTYTDTKRLRLPKVDRWNFHGQDVI